MCRISRDSLCESFQIVSILIIFIFLFCMILQPKVWWTSEPRCRSWSIAQQRSSKLRSPLTPPLLYALMFSSIFSIFLNFSIFFENTYLCPYKTFSTADSLSPTLRLRSRHGIPHQHQQLLPLHEVHLLLLPLVGCRKEEGERRSGVVVGKDEGSDADMRKTQSTLDDCIVAGPEKANFEKPRQP